ncbi:ribonuclease H protein [Trifolium medium]|uniref:Ribonuclease H protein n=1 Tax=Trifolium medium TaxID=97028 RepID=A0A392PQD4_9FABA|nr:ribonuclease H protein [Trifolium medium]
MLGEDDFMWKRVLEARYGVVARPNLTIGRGNNFSLWWKDLVGLGVERGVVGDWTHEVFIKKLGNGGSTRFWLDHWIGVAPLKEVFPRLYTISLQMDHTIQQMGEWVNDKWIWHIKWRRIFFTWEEVMSRNLWNLIGEVNITKQPDSWYYANGDMYTFGTVEGYCLFLASATWSIANKTKSSS